MTLAYVRKAYGVPAKRGGRVRYTGCGREELGTIIGASGGHLKVRLDGVRHGMPFHPTWKIEYLPEQPRGPLIERDRSRDDNPLKSFTLTQAMRDVIARRNA